MRLLGLSFTRVVTLALAVGSPLLLVAQQSPQGAGRTRLFSEANTSIVGSALLSPDGKWVVFSAMENPSKASLSVTRIGSGETRRITSTGWWDMNPQWSPAGDRIYFVSNRPAPAGDPNYYLMEVRFDGSSGQAVGEPRQVTTDAVLGTVRVSPDGKTLAFIDGKDRLLLKVVPVAGGAPRVLARMPVLTTNFTWSRDGRDVYFMTSLPSQAQRVLNRVPVAGGEIVAVSSNLPAQGGLLMGPGAEIFVAQENGDGPRDRLFKVYDRRGTLLQTIKSNRNTRATQMIADGRGIVAVESDVVAPTRIMTIEGGAHRDVTPPVTYDWVMRWSDDGKTVYTWTEKDGSSVLAAVPVSGGAPRVFPETAKWGSEGANSRYLFQVTKRDGTKPRSLVAVDLRDGSRHTITESAPGHNMIFPYGPGGTWASHEELYFFERQGDRLDVKAWRGPQDVRTLRSLPATLLGKSNVAIHGDRVVWQEERADSIDLVIAAGNGQPRRLLTMPALPGANEISFSNDGRLIALHYTRGPGSPDLMAFVDPSGTGAPRIVDTGLSYWYWPRWMPDNSGVLVVGGGAGAEANIVRIPVADGAKPVNITPGDPASKWGFEVSPDGKYIAYPGEIWKGSSIWRIDLAGTAR